jgi:hypothetical protein
MYTSDRCLLRQSILPWNIGISWKLPRAQKKKIKYIPTIQSLIHIQILFLCLRRSGAVGYWAWYRPRLDDVVITWTLPTGVADAGGRNYNTWNEAVKRAVGSKAFSSTKYYMTGALTPGHSNFRTQSTFQPLFHIFTQFGGTFSHTESFTK